MNSAIISTDYVLIQAYTNSEWDSCQYAILHLTDDWLKKTQIQLSMLKSFEGDTGFMHSCFYDIHFDFFMDNEQYSAEALLQDGKTWMFLETNEQEIQAMQQPESSLDIHHIQLLTDGHARFIAYGKHTDEEFYTERIDIGKLISQKFNH